MVLTNLYIIYTTDSIQGLMVFAAGFIVMFYFWLRSTTKFPMVFRIFYLIISSMALIATSLALVNRGPLARLIFQESIVLRGDYMHAGIEMIMRRPLFGVGLDSYGDWYREMRGQVTTFRGSPDRIANTAHNIFIDIGASGGLPLLLCFVMIIAVAFLSAWQACRRMQKYDPVLIGIFSCWLGFLVQALVSINQVGVGVWGWIFTGLLIAYGNLTQPAKSELELQKSVDSSKGRNKSRRNKFQKSQELLPPRSAVASMGGAALGFSLGFLPVFADASFRIRYDQGHLQHASSGKCPRRNGVSQRAGT
jgi:hypothetical protein